MDIYGALWSTGFKKTITSTAGVIAAVAGAVTAVPPAWSALDLPVVATRIFVLGETGPIKLAQSDTTRAVQQLQLQNLQSSLYAAKLDQSKNPGVQTIDQRVQDLEEQIKQTQTKVNSGH
jgi:hypothetical protein